MRDLFPTHCADDFPVEHVVGNDDDAFKDHLVAEPLFDPGGVPADGRVVGQEKLQVVQLLAPVHQADARQPAQGHGQGEHDHRVCSNQTPQPENKHTKLVKTLNSNLFFGYDKISSLITINLNWALVLLQWTSNFAEWFF